MAHTADAQSVRVVDRATGIGDVIGSIDHPLFFEQVTVTFFLELVVCTAADNLAFQSVQGFNMDDGTQRTGTKDLAVHIVNRVGFHGLDPILGNHGLHFVRINIGHDHFCSEFLELSHHVVAHRSQTLNSDRLALQAR